jgi:hypothetical protein
MQERSSFRRLLFIVSSWGIFGYCFLAMRFELRGHLIFVELCIGSSFDSGLSDL